MATASVIVASTLALPIAAAIAGGAACASETTIADGGDWAGTAWRIDTALRLDPARAPADPLLRSGFGIGDEDDLARFSSSYRFSPGEILSATGNRRPRQIARQVFRHDLGLVLDAFDGAPVDVRMHSETREAWTLDGHTRERRHGAELAWAPGIVRLDLQWSGHRDAVDAGNSLDCSWQGGLTVPGLAALDAGESALRVSGRDCEVLSPNVGVGPRQQLRAGTLAVSHAWTSDGLRHAFTVQRIAPYLTDAAHAEEEPAGFAGGHAAYEIAVEHSRRHEGWEASARASLRDMNAVSTHATLRRELSLAVVTATWVHGANALWFLPAPDRAIGDRLDLGVDLTRMMRSLAPRLAPQLAMQWKWWRTREGSHDRAGDSLLALHLSIDW